MKCAIRIIACGYVNADNPIIRRIGIALNGLRR